MFLAVFSNSLQEEELENGTSRTVLKLPAVLAPTKAAILPLVKKDGLPEVAREIVEELKWDFNIAYDEKDAVGRRYRRQDANGTPFCITVDHDTLTDDSVTMKHNYMTKLWQLLPMIVNVQHLTFSGNYLLVITKPQK